MMWCCITATAGFCYVIPGLSFNGDIFLFLCKRFRFLLWNGQSQDTVLEFALYIIVRHILAHIKASFAGAGITLLTDISAARLLLLESN